MGHPLWSHLSTVVSKGDPAAARCVQGMELPTQGNAEARGSGSSLFARLGLRVPVFWSLEGICCMGGPWRQVLSLGFCMESRERDELEPGEFLFRPWKITETLKIWTSFLLSPLSEVEPG